MVLWELINPVSMLHRGLIFGIGTAWMVVLAIFLFDLFVMSRGWCGRLCPVGAFYSLIGRWSPVPNHLTGDRAEDLVSAADLPQVEGRGVVAKRLTPVPVEAIVRGYLAGSGWKEYQQSGTVCGITLPAGLQEASQLPEPIFTPSTKAAVGDHDENISFARCEEIVGAELAAKVRDTAIALYKAAAEYAASRGIIICDTKFEFGIDEHGVLTLMDEALTPDSSRFWPADSYVAGSNPPSFDKQFVRDWLEASGWNKTPPAPAVPLDVREKTAAKYREALERLTG
jgi:phosphoribosylaminoimidazole-succinocarboxamide synthase